MCCLICWVGLGSGDGSVTEAAMLLEDGEGSPCRCTKLFKSPKQPLVQREWDQSAYAEDMEHHHLVPSTCSPIRTGLHNPYKPFLPSPHHSSPPEAQAQPHHPSATSPKASTATGRSHGNQHFPYFQHRDTSTAPLTPEARVPWGHPAPGPIRAPKAEPSLVRFKAQTSRHSQHHHLHKNAPW